MVEQDIAEGRLRVVSPESTSEIDIIMAWRRDSMGEAKAWCLRKIVADYPDARWMFVTLTVRNCDIADLGETLTAMNAAFQRMKD
ncbi:protein rep, partial [Salmonella enterica subsp. enterica serovar Kentucky]|nr:protein rep [Salmonella enterica subsp. enterica serovar Kentucky]